IAVASGATAIIPCQVDVGADNTGAGGDHVGFDATGGTIRIDGFRADGDNVFLKNVDIYCEPNAPYPNDMGKCAAPLRGCGNNFRMTGGSDGPTVAAGGTSPVLDDNGIGYCQPNGQITGWVLDGVHFHDAQWLNVCGGDCHTENLYLNSVANFTIKNSVFTN